MIFSRIILVLLTAFFSCLGFAQEPIVEPKTGEALAVQLRSMQPEGNSEFSGVLKIRSPKRKEDIPVVCKVVTSGDSWKTIYETAATTNRGAEKFVVIHSLNATNKYLYARAPSPKAPLPELKALTPAEAAIPLAGSDFWLSELGFDFLHWPVQRKLKGEMRIGQPCYVLESINPSAEKIVRIKSYIEKQSGSPLIAEAYDRNKELVKEFSLGGSSVKKINGIWQLKKMTIHSPKTKSETVLEFDLPPDQ